MATIEALVDNFLMNERPDSIVLDPATVLAKAVAATEFYAGYANLEANDGVDPPLPAIAANTVISYSEWALIKPLFMLMTELETSTQLEASRALGVDVFGRSSSEVQQEINQYQMELPQKAFLQTIITV
ncbi:MULTISPECIES: hypothetical protein [unclassified Nitrosomonas]|uniref:hypothetical protein n=1 Tax=unclassified Nitrosomonas TaxID=2609265 RepID=UPI000215D0D0|nr:hypothetical protein [Nitrosomonas sp.]